jgi:hypothetical protein
MTYAKLKELPPEAFKRYSGVKPETFRAMLEVLERAEAGKKKAGRRTRPNGPGFARSSQQAWFSGATAVDAHVLTGVAHPVSCSPVLWCT